MLAPFRRQEIRQPAGPCRHHGRRARERNHRLPLREARHDLLPQNLVIFPVNAFLGKLPVVVVAGPDAHREIRRVPDEPQVVVGARRPGLKRQRSPGSLPDHALHRVGKDKGRVCAHGAARLRRVVDEHRAVLI